MPQVSVTLHPSAAIWTFYWSRRDGLRSTSTPSISISISIPSAISGKPAIEGGGGGDFDGDGDGDRGDGGAMDVDVGEGAYHWQWPSASGWHPDPLVQLGAQTPVLSETASPLNARAHVRGHNYFIYKSSPTSHSLHLYLLITTISTRGVGIPIRVFKVLIDYKTENLSSLKF